MFYENSKIYVTNYNIDYYIYNTYINIVSYIIYIILYNNPYI